MAASTTGAVSSSRAGVVSGACVCLMMACGCPEAKTAKEETGVLAPLPAEHELVLHGPYATIDQHCNAFMALAASELGLDEGQLDYGCRTEVRAGGSKVPTVAADQLQGSFKLAKLFETGYVAPQFAGQVRVALQTDLGWFVSDPVVALDRASDHPDGGLTEGSIEAKQLIPATGQEVLFHLASSSASDGSALVACRASDGNVPHCVRVAASASFGADGSIAIGAQRYGAW